jgi:hypothetical protein
LPETVRTLKQFPRRTGAATAVRYGRIVECQELPGLEGYFDGDLGNA